MDKYQALRLRLALVLLLITGAGIIGIRELRVNQIRTLFEHYYIELPDFQEYERQLNDVGIEIIRTRKKDFEMMTFFKNEDSFIFTSQTSEEPLRMEVMNRIINTHLRPYKSLTSRSFKLFNTDKFWVEEGTVKLIKEQFRQSQYRNDLKQDFKLIEIKDINTDD